MELKEKINAITSELKNRDLVLVSTDLKRNRIWFKEPRVGGLRYVMTHKEITWHPDSGERWGNTQSITEYQNKLGTYRETVTRLIEIMQPKQPVVPTELTRLRGQVDELSRKHSLAMDKIEQLEVENMRLKRNRQTLSERVEQFAEALIELNEAIL